ncbi:MAG: hypothetical protein NTZ20_04785 [Candidatus Levybacteria bacterium]|nr:hypothetical protein [Candidatus Levybacteria bacterium]
MEDGDINLSNIHTRFAILEKDVTQMTAFLSRLENTMGKLHDTLISLRETIILHDLKLSNNEKTEIVDAASIKEISKRVDELNQFKWYASGIVALMIVLMPVVYKFILKM